MIKLSDITISRALFYIKNPKALYHFIYKKLNLDDIVNIYEKRKSEIINIKINYPGIISISNLLMIKDITLSNNKDYLLKEQFIKIQTAQDKRYRKIIKDKIKEYGLHVSKDTRHLYYSSKLGEHFLIYCLYIHYIMFLLFIKNNGIYHKIKNKREMNKLFDIIQTIISESKKGEE